MNLLLLVFFSYYDIIMDFSLQTVIDSDHFLSFSQIKLIMYQFLNAFHYLYQSNFYTGREKSVITPSQILFNSDGLTKFVPLKRSTDKTYQPPDGSIDSGIKEMKLRDVWSIGIILGKLVEKFTESDDDLLELIKKMLVLKKDRIKVEEAVDHQCFKESKMLFERKLAEGIYK